MTFGGLTVASLIRRIPIHEDFGATTCWLYWASMFIIFNGLKDWKEHPIIMTVDTFDSQLQNIDLPAVTLCPSPGKFQPDNWAQTEQQTPGTEKQETIEHA